MYLRQVLDILPLIIRRVQTDPTGHSASMSDSRVNTLQWCRRIITAQTNDINQSHRTKQATIVKKQRPVNLELNTISFPPSAISSILHRVTGVALFFALILVIGAWAISLTSAEGFASVQNAMNGWFGKVVAIGTLSALSYHILGGLRHMVMDMGHWEELQSGNTSAKVIIVLWIVLTVVAGVAVW